MAQEDEDAFDVIERNILDADNLGEHEYEQSHVIGASRSSKDVDELPLTAYVIDHKDIVNNCYITLCDVLKSVPGFRVSQPQSGELGEAFMQRGLLGNTYTKILINGIDIKPAGNYGMMLGANIPIRQAEKIEIIYGPASASYGNDACVGVINIVTREPERASFTTADLYCGTNSMVYLDFHAGAKVGHGKNVTMLSIYGSNFNVDDVNVSRDADLYNRWNYFLQNGDTLQMAGNDGRSYSITRSMINEDMFTKYSDEFSGMSYYFINYKGDFYTPEINEMPQNATQVGAEIKYRGLTFAYNMLHRMDFADFGQSSMTYAYHDPRNMLGEYIRRAAISADYKIGNVQTNTILRYIRYRMDKASSRGVNWNTLPQYAYGASDDVSFEENISWNPVSKFFINGGVSYQYIGVLPPTLECERKFAYDSYKMFATEVDYEDEVFGNFGIYPYTYWQAGAYMLMDFDWKNLTLNGGVRYDYNSQWGESINPRFAALYKIGNRVRIRASQAFAYKIPSPAQYYYCMGVAMETALGTVMALHHVPSNVDALKPERISSTEAGIRLSFSKDTYIEVVGYTNVVKDPLVRGWVKMEDCGFVKVPEYGIFVPNPANSMSSYYKQQGYYVGVTDLFSSTKGRDWTRAYKNETNAKTKLYGLQVIGRFKDIIPDPLHLDVNAALTLTMGHENLSNNDATDEKFIEVDYIRHTPKHLAQVSVECDLGKIFHIRFDNMYCSRFARMYYQATDNPYFWSPRYYNLDFSLTGKIGKNLTLVFKLSNVTNTLYAGIDVKNMDVDLPYNPQRLRTFSFGATYDF
ncbi:MAG: TonB-dependent receptor [Bacteroidales bacterium]|nr:TonB-dependent receptor [Bacteroidales bacterium]